MLDFGEAGVGGGVVDDDEFPVLIGLGEDAAEAFADEAFLVVDADDDTDERRVHSASDPVGDWKGWELEAGWKQEDIADWLSWTLRI